MGVQPAAPPTNSTVSQFKPRLNIPRPSSGAPQQIVIRPSRSTTYRRSRLLRAASQRDRAVTRIRPASIPVTSPRTVDAIPAIASSGSVAQPIMKPQQTRRVKAPGRVSRSETSRGTTRSRDRSGNNTRRCGDTESSMAKNNTDPKVHTSTRTAPAASIKGERASGRDLREDNPTVRPMKSGNIITASSTYPTVAHRLLLRAENWERSLTATSGATIAASPPRPSVPDRPVPRISAEGSRHPGPGPRFPKPRCALRP